MDTLLRKLAEWKGKRKAAQIIVFDGAAEIDKTRSFAKGTLTGIVCAFAVVLLTAPTSTNPAVMAEVEQREALIREANEKLEQAVAISATCLNTAETMGETLKAYQQVAEGYQRFIGGRR